jgi:hypothetical protein
VAAFTMLSFNKLTLVDRARLRTPPGEVFVVFVAERRRRLDDRLLGGEPEREDWPELERDDARSRSREEREVDRWRVWTPLRCERLELSNPAESSVIDSSEAVLSLLLSWGIRVGVKSSISAVPRRYADGGLPVVTSAADPARSVAGVCVRGV